MTFEPEFIAAMERAVTPTEADVLVARGVILKALGGSTEPVVITLFEDKWLAAHGAQRPSDHSKFAAKTATTAGRRLADPDPSDSHIMEFRGQHAVKRALAQLIAEGVVARGSGNQYDIQPEHIPVDYPGGSASAPVFVHSPYIGERGSPPRFMTLRPQGFIEGEALLPIEEFLADLDPVLGKRGATIVRESRRALQKGLYIAASSLLAAASEAAWFNVARSVPQPSSKLAQKLAEGRDISQVIQLTEQHLRELRPSPGNATITEVVTQAHMFREVRNYALHPVEDHDQDREAWLTETGATLLAIAARRYFVKLADLRYRLVNSRLTQT